MLQLVWPSTRARSSERSAASHGSPLVLIQLFSKQDVEFTELDEAVLAQLAQMASAAVERTLLYRRSTS
jgi:hypothetical protein